MSSYLRGSQRDEKLIIVFKSPEFSTCSVPSSYRDWGLAYAQIPGHISPYHNHWLVRRSAAIAFAQGVVKLDRLHPSMDEVSCDRCATKALIFFFLLLTL